MSELIPWDSHVIDLDDAMVRVLGRKDLYKKWLDSFFSDKDDSFGLINKSVETKDYDTAHRVMHKLKGTAGNLSVITVRDQAKLIDEKIQKTADLGELADDFAKLRECFDFAKRMYECNLNVITGYGE